MNKTMEEIQKHINKLGKDDPNVKAWAEIGRRIRRKQHD